MLWSEKWNLWIHNFEHGITTMTSQQCGLRMLWVLWHKSTTVFVSRAKLIKYYWTTYKTQLLNKHILQAQSLSHTSTMATFDLLAQCSCLKSLSSLCQQKRLGLSHSISVVLHAHSALWSTEGVLLHFTGLFLLDSPTFFRTTQHHKGPS